MNQQTLTAFHTFDTSLTNAINTLHDTLQETNSLNSMYAEQFNDIIKFQQNTKAFTLFLQEQNEYHKKQYAQFKCKMLPAVHNCKPSTTVSSQISIQSTPQSLDDWSYTANDRISNGSGPDYQRWRGYDPQPNISNNYNDFLFNNVEIERIPFKVIDTDNDSDCTSVQFVPSLPPSAPPSIHTVCINTMNTIDTYDNDCKIKDNDMKEHSDHDHDNDEDIYDVCDGIEDDEKWDYPLLTTAAFTGHFNTESIAQLEFKNDKVLKPPPAKWQEREEENRQIINTLILNEPSIPPPFLYNNNSNIVNEIDIEESIQTHQTEETTNGSVNDMMANDDCKSDDMNMNSNMNKSIIGIKRRRSMSMLPKLSATGAGSGSGVAAAVAVTDDTCTSATDDTKSELISKHVSFIKGQQPPLTFIQYTPPKPSIYDNNIEAHPHYHPLIHGNENIEGKHNDNDNDNQKQTAIDIDGEQTINDHQIISSNNNQISECFAIVNQRDATSQHCNMKQSNNMNEINKEIVTLRHAIDHHFNINHNDLTQVKHAIYSLRDHGHGHGHAYYHINGNTKRKKRRNQEQCKTKKKKLANLNNNDFY